MVVGSEDRESIRSRTPLKFLAREHMQPASAESKLEPLRKLLDDGQITPEVYRRAKEKVLSAASTPTAQTPQTQPEPEPKNPHGAPFDWTATELRVELASLPMGEVKARARLAGVEPAHLADAAIDTARSNPKVVTELIEGALAAVDSSFSQAFSRASLGPMSEPEKPAGSDIASDASYQAPTSLPATPYPDHSNMSTRVDIDQTTQMRVAALETVSSREWEAMLTHKIGNAMDRDNEYLISGAPSTEPHVASSDTCATMHSSRLHINC